MLTELAHSRGWVSCSLLLDIIKAFENVLHHILLDRAIRLDFNLVLLRFLLVLYRGL